MTPLALGVGCGGKDFADHPNVVRLVVGEPAAAAGPTGHALVDPQGVDLVEAQANVDDLDPRLWPGVLDALLAAGARDAWLAPITMKKGRPAFTVHVLATASALDDLVDVLLTHTSTLGVRTHPVARTMLERAFVELDVHGHPVQVKVGHRAGRVVHATAEFTSLAALARQLAVPEQHAATLAQAEVARAGLLPGEAFPRGN